MNRENALNSLLERSNHLKSKLIKEQLRNNNFYFTYSEKYLSAVLNEYKIHKSIFKAASKLRFDPNMIMDWYIQGLGGNPKFRGFSLVINEINNKKKVKIEDNDSQVLKIMKLPKVVIKYLNTVMGGATLHILTVKRFSLFPMNWIA